MARLGITAALLLAVSDCGDDEKFSQGSGELLTPDVAESSNQCVDTERGKLALAEMRDVFDSTLEDDVTCLKRRTGFRCYTASADGEIEVLDGTGSDQWPSVMKQEEKVTILSHVEGEPGSHTAEKSLVMFAGNEKCVARASHDDGNGGQVIDSVVNICAEGCNEVLETTEGKIEKLAE